MNTLKERIHWVMQHFDLTQTQLATIAKVKQPSVANWLNGRTTSIRSENALAICERLNVPTEWLIKGEGYPDLNTRAVASVDDDSIGDDLVEIKTYRVRCGAGPSQVPTFEDISEPTPFYYRRTWLQKNSFKAEKLMRLEVHGESMEPLLWDGDHITIDTTQTAVLDGRVYAFTFDGEFRVKRMYKLLSGGVSLYSDNSRFPPEEIRPEDLERFKVLGRVIDKCGRGGL